MLVQVSKEEWIKQKKPIGKSQKWSCKGMIEKYYLVVEVSGDLAKIYDNISEENIMDVNEAVDKLNELTQENQILKAENILLKKELKKDD